jgi:hypothetical protein
MLAVTGPGDDVENFLRGCLPANGGEQTSCFGRTILQPFFGGLSCGQWSLSSFDASLTSSSGIRGPGSRCWLKYMP